MPDSKNSKAQLDAVTRLTKAYIEAVSGIMGKQARVVVAIDPDPADNRRGAVVLHAIMEVSDTLSVLSLGISTLHSIHQDFMEAQISTKH